MYKTNKYEVKYYITATFDILTLRFDVKKTRTAAIGSF